MSQEPFKEGTAEKRTPPPLSILSGLTDSDSFIHIDLHFAELMNRLAQRQSSELFLAAALVNQALRDGHSCIDLAEFAGKACSRLSAFPVYPSLQFWIRELKDSQIAGSPGSYCPLILDQTRLYLYRYWRYEQMLGKNILARITLRNECDKSPDMTVHLNELFSHDFTPDWQKIGAAAAIMNNFTVISGGPGTGKTTTVAKLLAILLLTSSKKLRIALAAPTGKAAARLSDSILSVIPDLPVPQSIKDAIPVEARTIHRLLGTIPDSPYFRHNEKKPLPYDLILIDEASMVDLALMAKLVMAVPLTSRLILLGDRDQLSSVEAGAVLGDICDSGTMHGFTPDRCSALSRLIPGTNIRPSEEEPLISNSIITLQKSFRFSEHSGIGILSRAVNQGDFKGATNILLNDTYPECVFTEILSEQAFRNALREKILSHFSSLHSLRDPLQALETLERFKILSSLRIGPFGTESINKAAVSILAAEGFIRAENRLSGQPIMVNGNDYLLEIYNGDTGIMLCDTGGNLRAVFKGTGSTVRSFLPRQLPSAETAYAMTVHKSQGSEYDEILLILPPLYNQVLTRELLYTAITRARKKLEVWGSIQILEKAIQCRVSRKSGLRDLLWNNA